MPFRRHPPRSDTRHIVDIAACCPASLFVVGGYSQGASVADIALGVPGSSFLGRGESLPSALASRIAAVVVFGNPLSNFGGTIESTSPTYGPRAKSFCGRSDTVCGGDRNGNIDGGHLDYRTNGAVDQAATFAAAQVKRPELRQEPWMGQPAAPPAEPSRDRTHG